MATKKTTKKPAKTGRLLPAIYKTAGSVMLADYCDKTSQHQAADEIRTSQGLVSRWCAGLGRPGRANAVRLSQPPFNIPMTAWDDPPPA